MLWVFKSIRDRILNMRSWHRLYISLGLLIIFIFGINADFNGIKPIIKERDSVSSEVEMRNMVTKELGFLVAQNEFPVEKDIEWNGSSEKVRVLYTFDKEIQLSLEKLLKSYGADYSSVVAMDATTGKILAMASFEGSIPSIENRTMKATFPAASIFKIVTASAAIEKYGLSPEMELGYTGANYTLYKKNLFNDNPRWARWISFREAFSKSINIFFGKMTLKFMQPNDLIDFAERFNFNKPLNADFPLESSTAALDVEDQYQVAEVASGFNSKNTLSPVHGALLAATIANDGNMPAPYIVEGIFKEDGSTLYKAKTLQLGQPISMATATKLRSMMTDTVETGTSRKSFKELTKKKSFDVIEMGGKTGSLMGANPKGKTDWFVGYGRLGPRMIAIAAVTVNKSQWRVKSSYLAQKIIREYFEAQATVVTSHYLNRNKEDRGTKIGLSN
jgi:cell division protein FtsI/penicillin-binding protein 2